MSYLLFAKVAKVVKATILINITADAGAQNNHWIDIAPRKTSTLANLIAVVHALVLAKYTIALLQKMAVSRK